tara:strand:- start:18734 stop:19504 length:771 start_codon:yes stop_codon:yes gene_type:complete
MSILAHTPKCVLITGATSDFGKAFAHKFAAHNIKLILHGRNRDKLNALSEELDTPHHLMVFDCNDEASIAHAFDTLPAEFENIDLLINNAGGALGGEKFHESDIDDSINMVGANITSLISISHKAMQNMVKNKSGHIINIGSVAGNWPYPGGHVYCASKAFTRQFSLALRADLDGTNIRVTNIEPGMTETSFALNRFKGDEEKANKVYANANPLQADDICETVFWCATMPEHVNINTLEIMSQRQSFGPLAVERRD